jgi:cytochrome bd-type quinol oxidase subunit 2
MPLHPDFTRSARRLGVTSAVVIVTLGISYLACLVIGLASLPSPQDPIADPWFTALELLILAMMPFMVTLMISVHAWSARANKVQSMAAVVFTATARPEVEG